jgi:preprotein translocase subunit SecD
MKRSSQLDQMAGELEGAFKEKKGIDVETERVGRDTLLVHFQNPEDINLATEDVMATVAGYLERDTESGLEAEGTMRMTVPSQIIEDAQKAVIGQAIETVRRRVDAMGVAEPNIYPKNRQVVIALPGVSDTATELRAAATEAANQLMTLLRDRWPDPASRAADRAIDLRIADRSRAHQRCSARRSWSHRKTARR